MPSQRPCIRCSSRLRASSKAPPTSSTAHKAAVCEVGGHNIGISGALAWLEARWPALSPNVQSTNPINPINHQIQSTIKSNQSNQSSNPIDNQIQSIQSIKSNRQSNPINPINHLSIFHFSYN
jgi:hypothetical protein